MSWKPSEARVNGANKKKERIVIRENRLILSRAPCKWVVLSGSMPGESRNTSCNILAYLATPHEFLGEDIAGLEGEI